MKLEGERAKNKYHHESSYSSTMSFLDTVQIA